MIMESRSKVTSEPFEKYRLTTHIAPQHSDSKEKKNWFGNITESQKQALEVNSKPRYLITMVSNAVPYDLNRSVGA